MKSSHLQIKSAINSANHILLHLHPHPDADSAGSALAFYHCLKSINKKVTLISGDSYLPINLSTLPGADQITPKNYFDLDLNQFDLFIILDSSAPDQISKLGPIVFPKTLRTIVIDHHASNAAYGDINLIDVTAPATCQVVYQLFEKLKIKITPDIAACLFAGLYTDSGGFKYSPTSFQTFDIASKLSKIYPNFSQIIFELENNDSPEDLKFLGLLLNNIETYFNNRVAIASLSLTQIRKAGLSVDQATTGGVANMLKAVVGWDIGISMIETEPHQISVSLRTRDAQKYNLSQIVLATGFGGGHKAAAGATIPFSLPKAKKILLDCIQKLHPDL